jgi:hypothetical protein
MMMEHEIMIHDRQLKKQRMFTQKNVGIAFVLYLMHKRFVILKGLRFLHGMTDGRRTDS